MQYIEDIYFFEVNTKYISSSMLKTSEFSRVHSMVENSDVFNSRDEIYLVRGLSKKFVESVNKNKASIPITFKFVYN